MRGKEPGKPRQSVGLGWRAGGGRSRNGTVWVQGHHGLGPGSADGAGVWSLTRPWPWECMERVLQMVPQDGEGLPGLLSHLGAGPCPSGCGQAPKREVLGSCPNCWLSGSGTGRGRWEGRLHRRFSHLQEV